MRKLVAWFLVFSIGLAVVVAGAGAWAWHTVHQPYKGFAGSEHVVEISSGLDAGRILQLLEREGILDDSLLARLYLVYALDGPSLKAGEYRFEGEASTEEVLEKLIRGEIVTYPVTLIEGLTLVETARYLADQGFGDFDRLIELTSTPALITDLDPDATDLEGYLFPDTYAFARGTSEDKIVAAAVETFHRRFEEEVRPLLEPAEERSVREIITLASIVEKEARVDEERPMIAGVFANRLEHGVPLQADPTVIFALKRLGQWDGNLRRADLKLDSPYNTYVYAGLPPGPIASPGLASLLAAASPAEVPYFYFVSRNDGSHVFAKTLSEHNRNVTKWQKEYWRKKWAEERRQKTESGG